MPSRAGLRAGRPGCVFRQRLAGQRGPCLRAGTAGRGSALLAMTHLSRAPSLRFRVDDCSRALRMLDSHAMRLTSLLLLLVTCALPVAAAGLDRAEDERRAARDAALGLLGARAD